MGHDLGHDLGHREILTCDVRSNSALFSSGLEIIGFAILLLVFLVLFCEALRKVALFDPRTCLMPSSGSRSSSRNYAFMRRPCLRNEASFICGNVSNIEVL